MRPPRLPRARRNPVRAALHELGPRPPRLPRPAPPDALAADFAAKLVAFFDAWIRDLWIALGAVESEGRDEQGRIGRVRLDARVPGDWRSRLQIITQERFRADPGSELDELVSRAGNAVVRKPPPRGDWIDRIARLNATTGVATQAEAARWKTATLDKIVSLPGPRVAEIEPLISSAIDRGLATEVLQKQILSVIGDPDDPKNKAIRWQAERIARDQVLTFNAKIRETRQKSLGIREFIWRTSGDGRVRESHEEVDGQKFSYDDPPNLDGESALPGEPILCRCTAEAVVPEDLADLFDP